MAFRGARFLGASWRPGADRAVLSRLRALTSGWTVAEGEGWLLAADKAHVFAQTADVAFALAGAYAFDRTAGALVSAATLAAKVGLQGSDALDGLAPPFRGAWLEKTSGALHAATDVFGLGQVFLAAEGGVAALASSATLLGDLMAASLASDAMAAYAAFGSFLPVETPFAGVTKLSAGARATLSQGRIEISTGPRLPINPPSTEEALRGAVAAMLQALPDAELELSGGLDSRMILAAMPSAARRGRTAFTLGVVASPSDDVRVARGLAETEGLNWSVLDIGGMAALDGRALEELLAHAVASYDHMGNPIDKAALLTAGEGRTPIARFSGQNGEILRGFFYPGQPLGAAPSEALARRLISWRLLSNDRVADALLAPALRGELRARAERRMVEALLSLGGTWGQTLDRFYLAQRMQSWVGNAVSNRQIEHLPFYPFFDPAFVAAALATSCADKRNSRAAYQLLSALDPALARRPLADGVVPAAFPTSSIGAQLLDLQLNAARFATRLKRRLAKADKATLGSQTVAQQWHRLRLYEHLPLDGLARSGLFDPAGLARIASGEWLPDRPTLGFLLLVAGLETRP